ncbi:MAG: type I 3-dehydroquinate dehydratase [archaeon]|jgi:3-dehydroquinate dehydratase type I|nr:type I 3-dehydroquinate dehydratase [archaeon]
MIAVPITAENFDSALEDIEVANSKADIIELRLDFLQEVNETILEELLEKCQKPVIVTYRNKNFGAAVEPTERMFILRKAIALNAHFVDLDFDEDKEVIADIIYEKGGTAVILSHHDFEKTPSFEELVKLLDLMDSSFAPDIFKIVTFARNESDNNAILKLVETAKASGKKIIGFCMGQKGISSRIESIKAGAVFTFASLGKGKESAQGQLLVEEMRKELEKNA